MCYTHQVQHFCQHFTLSLHHLDAPDANMMFVLIYHSPIVLWIVGVCRFQTILLTLNEIDELFFISFTVRPNCQCLCAKQYESICWIVVRLETRVPVNTMFNKIVRRTHWLCTFCSVCSGRVGGTHINCSNMMHDETNSFKPSAAMKYMGWDGEDGKCKRCHRREYDPTY